METFEENPETRQHLSPHAMEIAKWKRDARAFVDKNAEQQKEEFPNLDVYMQDMIVSQLLRIASCLVSDHSGGGDTTLPHGRPTRTNETASMGSVASSTDEVCTPSSQTTSSTPTSSISGTTHRNSDGMNSVGMETLRRDSVYEIPSMRTENEQYYMDLLTDLLLTVEPSKALYLLARYISLRVIKRLFPRLKQHMRAVTRFPRDSVGRVTSLDYVCVQEQWTCAEALQYVHWLISEQERRFRIMNQILHDEEGHFQGRPVDESEGMDPEDMTSWERFIRALSIPFRYVSHKMGLNRIRKRYKDNTGQSILYASPDVLADDEVQEKISDQRHVSVLYVTDPQTWKLLGVVPVMELLAYCAHATHEKQIKDIAQYNIPTITAWEDRENTIMILKYYHMNEIPVVNKDGTLLSVVTVRKCMEVYVEESTEDHLHQVGVGFIGSKKLHRLGPLVLLLKRSMWLVVLVLVNLVSSNVIGAFQDILARYIALSFFIPLLIGTSGNVGSQAATILIRSIAMGEVTKKTVFKYFLREIFVIAGISAILAVVGFGIAIVRAEWAVGVVVGMTMFIMAWFSDMLGFCLPFVLQALHIDAAIATGPVITTILDAAGLLIYFGTATLLLDVLGWGTPGDD